MINSVSYGKIPSVVSTPSKMAFRGSEEVDSVKLSKIDAETIRTKTDEFSANVDAVADSVNKTADSVTNAATKTTGAVAMIGAAFSKLIPAPVKDFFATPQFTQNEAGEKILQTVKGSDGIERVVRKFNKKNTLIALGVAATLAGGIALYKYLKNRPQKPQEPQQTQEVQKAAA